MGQECAYMVVYCDVSYRGVYLKGKYPYHYYRINSSLREFNFYSNNLNSSSLLPE